MCLKSKEKPRENKFLINVNTEIFPYFKSSTKLVQLFLIINEIHNKFSYFFCQLIIRKIALLYKKIAQNSQKYAVYVRKIKFIRFWF